MHIVEAINRIDLRAGGPSRAVLDLSLAMTRRGHDVTILTRFAQDIPQHWFESDAGHARDTPRAFLMPTRRWARARNAGDASGEASLERLISTADVLHLHGVWEAFNLKIASVARAKRIPYVVTLRGMLDDWSMAQRGIKKRLYLAFAGTRYLEHAAIVQCTADAELYQSEKWFPRGRGRVVPNLLDLAPFQTMPGPNLATSRFPFLAGNRPWLLFLGRLSAKKGIEYLIDAVDILRRAGCKAGLAIAGAAESEAYLETLKARVRKYDLQDDVHIVGHVTGAVKVSLLEVAAMTVSLTSQENFGFVFYESLAAGTPVVTTPLIDTADELSRSGGCFLVQQDPGAAAKLVTHLLSNPAELRDRGLRARDWIFREHDTGRIAKRYEQMFRDAAAHGRAGELPDA